MKKFHNFFPWIMRIFTTISGGLWKVELGATTSFLRVYRVHRVRSFTFSADYPPCHFCDSCLCFIVCLTYAVSPSCIPAGSLFVVFPEVPVFPVLPVFLSQHTVLNTYRPSGGCVITCPAEFDQGIYLLAGASS